MTSAWHADDDLLTRYVRGDAGGVIGASLEQHLTHCPDCRARIAAHVDPQPLDLTWARIREQVQAPAPGLVERLLIRLGVCEPDALLIAVAPSLRSSWLLGLLVTLSFVALTAAFGGSRGLTLFLLIAPLVPVAGVAVAYGPAVDDAYELSVAAPYSTGRLLLLRTAVVLATSLPLVLTAALMLPGFSWTVISWLLPALAFTAVVLAVSSWADPTDVGVVIAIAWVGAVGAATLRHDPAAVVGPEPLLAYGAIAIVSVLVLGLRINRFAFLGRMS